MRIAALYDIHGNLPALEAVLDDVAQHNVDAIIFGGDVVAGPFPTETLETIAALNTKTHFIHGNAESELLRHLAGEPVGGLTPLANELAGWIGDTLSREHAAHVATWQSTLQIGSTLFCHATPHSDLDIFHVEMTDDEIRPKLTPIPPNVTTIVCGHTHMQFTRQLDGVTLINAGSIGMPFGATGAFWLLIDDDTSIHQHTTYDLQAAAERVRQSVYPHADQFANNNILSAPSREDALAMLRRFA